MENILVPKRVHKIDGFHGGLNNSSDPRDIADNELSSANDIMVDRVGRISMMGGTSTLTSASVASGVIRGRGMFPFQSDYSGAEGGSVSESSTNYIAVMDADEDAHVDIYDATNNAWSSSAIMNMLGGGGNIEASFYYVDGALRLSDGNFGNNNNINRWYSYISRTLFAGSNTYSITSGWYDKNQKIDSPNQSNVETSIASTGVTYSTEKTVTSLAVEGSYVADDDGGLGTSNISKVLITWTAVSSESTSSYHGAATIQVGGCDSSDAFTGTTKTINVSFDSSDPYNTATSEETVSFEYPASDLDMDGSTSTGLKGVKVNIGSKGEYGSGTFKITQIVYKSASGLVTLPHTNLSVGNVEAEIAFDAPTIDDAIDWAGTGGFKWKSGVSFIYDKKQESLITEMTGSDISAGTEGHCPTIKMNFKYSSNWNERITGAVLYMKKVESSGFSSWHPQVKYNFIDGKATVYNNGYEESISYDGAIDEYSWNISRDKMMQPNLADTYESETGIQWDEKSIHSKYKHSVLVGRTVYIGGVQVQYENGDPVETFSDAMIKSVPNKFDLFPISNKIEASINDGEDITALATFADRILQFKKNTLYILNVSQESEFLEGTYNYMGVDDSSSVCRTDYGIAWANKNGCYLYDGRTVKNLLEKKGIKIISDDDWDAFLRSTKDVTTSSFTRLVPMVGYSPKKKQIVVYEDNGNGESASEPNCYIYDIVTSSWVTGGENPTNRIIQITKTNFSNDANGDLIYAYTSPGSTTTTIKKWDNSPIAGSIDVQTKNMDFGYPAVRKKIYKILITHKKCGVNESGVSTTKLQYKVNLSTGEETGWKDLTDGVFDNNTTWETQEFKTPSTSSDWNSPYSIQLKILPNSGNPSSTFEINDISIIYRMKNVK